MMPTCFHGTLSACALTLLMPISPVLADDDCGHAGCIEKPLWELGFGAGVLDAPDYPGADQRQMRTLALPYVVYRGEVLRIGDGQSARAVAATGQRYELSLSFDAAFDANSEDNRAREGMTDLDYLFELGPRWSYRLLETGPAASGHGELDLSLQVRAVLSTNLDSLSHRGYVAEPMLRYRHNELLSGSLDLAVTLRPVWADQKLQGYFYDVSDADSRPDRPAFHARAGYFGTHLNISATWHLSERLRVFGGLQTLWQNGNGNNSSPLFRDSPGIGAGAGFTWSALNSERTVTRR